MVDVKNLSLKRRAYGWCNLRLLGREDENRMIVGGTFAVGPLHEVYIGTGIATRCR